MKYFFLLFCLVLSYTIKCQTILSNETNLKGKIGNYNIRMQLAIPHYGATTCFIVGEYYYLSTKKSIKLCSEDNRRIIEYVDGKPTGYFILPEWDKRVGERVRGIWYSMNKKRKYPVELVVTWKSKE